LNGHLVTEQNRIFDYTQLKTEESRIFGNTDERSSIIIKPCVIKSEENVSISNTPHHNSNYCDKSNDNCNYGRNGIFCFKSKRRNAKLYEFNLDLRFNPNIVSEEIVKLLITNTFLLGGIGNRSRRGFGSIRVKNNSIFTDKVNLEKHVLSLQGIQKDKGYPHIKSVQVGKKYDTYEEVLIAIGEASHVNKHNSLGHTNQRFASPIYTSVVKLGKNEFYPIITTLCTADKNNSHDKLPTKKQSNFISALT
jgi:CRISPR-associated protein Cmr1